MQEFEKEIRDFLSGQTETPPGEVVLEAPKKRELGDFAFPCFALAGKLKRNPASIANEIAEQWRSKTISVKAAGPYLNFTIDRAALARSVFEALSRNPDDFGRGTEGEGKTIVIDYSSPNIAKPFGVGHLRSTVIGAAVKRILEFRGHRCVGINHLGDWGMQFGRMMAAVRIYDPEESFASAENPSKALLDLYVRFHKEEKDHPELKEKARELFLKLESGEETTKELWERLIQISLREFEKIYKMLGVGFEKIQGESFYEDMLESTVERIQKAGVTEISEGALIVDLEGEKLPPCLLKTGQGTTLYATRDLAALFYRHETWKFDKVLYVVGSEQRLHFRQLKAVLRKMKLRWSEDVIHVDFGMMKLKEGKLSTREGRVIYLEEVLNRAVALVEKIIEEKNPDLPHREEVAAAVGVGAVVFNDLKNSRIKDVVFDWDTALNFDGETGPYVQYTHARLCSILRKHGKPVVWTGHDASRLKDGGALTALLGRFPQAVRRAAEEYEPSILTSYILDTAKAANQFYRDHRVLGEERETTNARIAMVAAARAVLHNGLGLLGIRAPEEM